MGTYHPCTEAAEKSIHRHQTRQPVFGAQNYYFCGQSLTHHIMSIYKNLKITYQFHFVEKS
jgi:hypothetical protein